MDQDTLRQNLELELALNPKLVPPERPQVRGLLSFDVSSFDSLPWKAHRKLWGCNWDRAGTLEGKFCLEVLGPRLYRYIPDPVDPFRFLRHSGELIQPGRMLTDCGSVPRVVWSIPGLDPMTYAAAFLLHDWLYIQHHCGQWNGSFEDANRTLGEAVYTQMTAAVIPFLAPCDWLVAVTIYEAVQSFVGRRVWAAEWTDDEKFFALNP